MNSFATLGIRSLVLVALLAAPAAAEEAARPVQATVRLGLRFEGDVAAARAAVERRLLQLGDKGAAPVSAVVWEGKGREQTAVISLTPSPCRGRILECIGEAIVRGGDEPEPACTPASLEAWQATIRDAATRPGRIVFSRAARSVQRPLHDALVDRPALENARVYLDDRSGVEIEGADEATIAAEVAAVKLDGHRVVWELQQTPPFSRAILHAVPDKGLVIHGVQQATVRADDGWDPQVVLTLLPEDKEAFGELTRRSVQEILTIELDGRLVSAPVVMEPILGGQASILMCSAPDRGPACLEETARMAAIFAAGALPSEVTATKLEGACTVK